MGLAGCAHAPEGGDELKLSGQTTPEALLAEVCSIGQSVHEVKGVVLMKVKSKEATGQLSGDVHAQEPGSLQFEILQPMGGVWATVKIEGQDYSIDVAGKPEQSRKGHAVWAGIPLRFANDLFLGRIPCAKGHAVFGKDQSGQEVLIVTGAGANETYLYRFRSLGDGPADFWPESLSWRYRGYQTVTVDFRFDEPEKGTRSPLRWEAHSTGGPNSGEMKLHWRSRDLNPPH
jgi:hypothetical protein